MCPFTSKHNSQMVLLSFVSNEMLFCTLPPASLGKIWQSSRAVTSSIAFMSSCANPVLYFFAGKSYIRREGLAFMARLFEGTGLDSANRKSRQNSQNSREKDKDVDNVMLKEWMNKKFSAMVGSAAAYHGSTTINERVNAQRDVSDQWSVSRDNMMQWALLSTALCHEEKRWRVPDALAFHHTRPNRGGAICSRFVSSLAADCNLAFVLQVLFC